MKETLAFVRRGGGGSGRRHDTGRRGSPPGIQRTGL